MRTLVAGMTTHLATRAHKRCGMLRLDLKDGSTIALTDHSADIDFDLGDGAVTYVAGTGILPSDLTLSTGFEADEVEVSGPIGSVVSQVAVIGGRFDDAVARYFMVNWSNLANGAIQLMKGRVALAEVMGKRFKFTLHSEIGKFSQTIGKVLTPYCRADFGDAQCGLTAETLAGTVTAVTDERQFIVSFSGAFADDYFTRGSVTWDTGNLAGIRPIEIEEWTAAGSIALFMPLPAPPEVGDTLTIIQGCFDPTTGESKTRTACKFFENMVNFRGEPDVPGSDQTLRYQVPSE